MVNKKIALVTGANSGMGKASVAALADKGFHVIMLCRSEERGRKAFQDISVIPTRSIELMFCDLGSMRSIREFCKSFLDKFEKLDILINNAGVITLDRRETDDGLELQFGVNHIGHFLLTMLLLNSLEKAEAGRIVVYSSGAHMIGKIHFDDINLKKSYSGIKSYSQSKLANILFTRELARRLRERGSPVVINACHPGAVATDMGIDRTTGFGKTIVNILRPFFLTPEEGCKTGIFLACDESVSNVSGEYFYKSKIAKTSLRSKNMIDAERLFKLSEKICEFEPSLNEQ